MDLQLNATRSSIDLSVYLVFDLKIGLALERSKMSFPSFFSYGHKCEVIVNAKVSKSLEFTILDCRNDKIQQLRSIHVHLSLNIDITQNKFMTIRPFQNSLKFLYISNAACIRPLCVFCWSVIYAVTKSCSE